MAPPARLYHAIVWQQQPESVGTRVTVLAMSLEEAEGQLREKYGEQSIITLHNEEDANSLRG